MQKTCFNLIALALTISAITASPLAQAIEPHQWLITGIGSDSCASYVLALEEHRPTAAAVLEGKTYYTQANAYTQWISGFVTSANLMGKPGQGQINVDVNGIALWIKNFCEANPSESIVSGASAFIRAHRPKVK